MFHRTRNPALNISAPAIRPGLSPRGKSLRPPTFRGKACAGPDCDGDCDPDVDDTADELELTAEILLSLFGEDAVGLFDPVPWKAGKSYEPCRDDRGRFAECGEGGYTAKERESRSTARMAKADGLIHKARAGALNEQQMGELGDHLLTMTKDELTKIADRSGLRLPPGKFAEAKVELVARMGHRIRMSSDAEQANRARREADKPKPTPSPSTPTAPAEPQGAKEGSEESANSPLDNQSPKRDNPISGTTTPDRSKAMETQAAHKISGKVETARNGKPFVAVIHRGGDYDAATKAGSVEIGGRTYKITGEGDPYTTPDRRTDSVRLYLEPEKTPGEKTITKGGMRDVDAYRPGNVIRHEGEWHVVTGHQRRMDDHGSYEHTLTLRPANESEQKQGRVGELRAELRAMGAGPDDDRDRPAHEARMAVIDGEIRKLEGRPSAEEEVAAKPAAAAQAGGTGDRIGEAIDRSDWIWSTVAEKAGIDRKRMKAIVIDGTGEPTPQEVSAIERVLGVKL